MREILFRGKRVDNGEWVYGDLLTDGIDYTTAIRVHNANEFGESAVIAVIPETVGQYIGLTDKNGKKIFEGNILYIKIGHGECVVGKAIVCFDEKVVQYRVREIRPYAYDSKVGYKYRECDFSHIYSFEVIGNKWDNPELVEGE